MRHLLLVALALALGVTVGAAVSRAAQADTLGFEDLPTSGSYTTPTDHYVPSGVDIVMGSGHGLRGWAYYANWFTPYAGTVSLGVPYTRGLSQFVEFRFVDPITEQPVAVNSAEISVGHLWHTYYVSELGQTGLPTSTLTVTGTVDADWRTYAFSSPLYGIRIQTSAYDSFAVDALTYDVGVVPEPTSVVLWGVGLVGLAVSRRRRKRRTRRA